MSAPWKEAKLIESCDLEEKINWLRAKKKTIVTLNGAFDLLHAGHLQIIYEASKQGNCLIVALNTDHSIQEYKGLDRPLISLEHRLQMIAALELVNYVTYFDESDPCALLAKIKPDVHVNGAEYGESCIEAKTVKENGGRLHIFHRIPNLSTSDLIEKIQSLELANQ